MTRREVSRLRSGARPPRTPPRLPRLASDSVRSAPKPCAGRSFRKLQGLSRHFASRDGATGSLGLTEFLAGISAGASLSGAYFIYIYRCLRFTGKFVAARGFGVWSQSCALKWRRQRLVGTMSFVFRGSRADIEAGGFPGFAPERRAMVSVRLLNP